MCFCMLLPASHSQKLHSCSFISPPVFCPSSSALPLPQRRRLFVSPDALCGSNSQLQHVDNSCGSHVVVLCTCTCQSQSPIGTSGEGNSQKMNRSGGHETCVSRVTEVPAEVPLWEGDRELAADSQGQAVDVSPRLGMETGVDMIGHAVRMGDAVGETEELIRMVELSGGRIGTWMSFQKHWKNLQTKNTHSNNQTIRII